MTITIRKMRMAAISVAAWGLLGNMAQAGPLHVANGQFVDTAGNVVVLRGTALSQHTKIPPFEPVTDPSIFPRLKSLGYNLGRTSSTGRLTSPAPVYTTRATWIITSPPSTGRQPPGSM